MIDKVLKNRAILVGFKIFMLLIFFMGFAKSKVHGVSYPGSYTDMTVNVSLYNFIFGLDGRYGDIAPNFLMILGFIAFVLSGILSTAFVMNPSKSSSIASLIVSAISVLGLSPIGISTGISQYNASTSSSLYDHRIKMTLMPFLLLIALIIMFFVELYIHNEYKNSVVE